MSFMNKIKVYDRDDFICKCGCNVNNINSRIVNLCNELYDVTGVYIGVNSGYRCVNHSIAIGSNENSSHCKGLAVDLDIRDNRIRFQVIKAAMSLGVTRIGISDNFCHFDFDPDKAGDIIWLY